MEIAPQACSYYVEDSISIHNEEIDLKYNFLADDLVHFKYWQ